MATDRTPGGIEQSLVALGRAFANRESPCGATTERDRTTLTCAGITCAMFPGEHKAFGIEPGWSDSTGDRTARHGAADA